MADAANSAPFLDPFDPLDFPDDFPSDLDLAPDFLSDLVFDGDVEFSIEDLLDYPDADPPSDGCAGGGCGDPEGRPGGSESKERSGVSSSSPISGNGTSSPVSGNSASASPRSGNYAACSPDSSNSATVAAGEEKLEEEEEEGKGLGLKRKKERADGEGNREVNRNGSGYVRSSKSRRSGPLDEASSPCLSNAEYDDDEKRKARLIRNRESALLSRQRKKHYVEELEEKVRSMHSMITDLNGKISYFMAENASLRQQLGGKGGSCPPPAVYSAVPPMVPMPYPWIPGSGYAVRPAGAQVPLIPIPRLKPQQPTSTSKPKKSDGKKAESKTKKVASVSLLGLLAFMFFVGNFVPGVDFKEGGYENLISYGYGNSRSGILDQSRGRILSVSGNITKLNPSDEAGLCGGDAVCRKNDLDKLHKNRLGSGLNGNGKPKEVVSQPSPNLGRSSTPENASQPLLASLYVPRNDKLVKIDGNLIISSVLASERAMRLTSSESKSYKTKQSSAKSSKETGLAIASSLAVPKLGRDAGRQSHMYRSSSEYQKALPHGFTEMYKDNLKSTPGDGPLKEWFREGLEGPIFSSGMCTEAFQFDVAPASGSIIPATSMVNGSNAKAQKSSPVKMKNRRILYSQPIPLNGSTLNNTEEGFAKPPENSSFHSTKSAKSMVVSVLVDPREAGDGDGVMEPKSISRIFVVVLVDSVKYITYSCVLPFKSSAPHLVTN